MVNYLKEFRPVINTSTEEAPGSGFLYQIDATIADVYLVSENNRERIIGRPTMYFVADGRAKPRPPEHYVELPFRVLNDDCPVW